MSPIILYHKILAITNSLQTKCILARHEKNGYITSKAKLWLHYQQSQALG